MYENVTLQEAYTGSLIAGKGKTLNNIRVIMERTKIRNEDWARVRFGAGTPWRRCWCVITPPDEKDVQKQQKQLRKKSAYERSTPVLKGNIKFYDTKKTKKATPIATINDAYSAYAIYPQSKPLIEKSTLIKVEGNLTIHSKPETTTEGFLFVMPEVHPAISGFEMLLRFLFPLYDVFALYGRPNRLIADTLDLRSLMFALPQERRYGYLEILDVSTLIHEPGSQSWSEGEWRKRLRALTQQRMQRMTANGRPRSRASSYRGYRNSMSARAVALRYEDGASIKSTPSLHQTLRDNMAPMPPPHKPDSAPPVENESFAPPQQRPKVVHQRSFSEASPTSTPRRNRSMRNGADHREYTPTRPSHDRNEGVPSSRTSFDRPLPPQPVFQAALPNNSNDQPPLPPTHGIPVALGISSQRYVSELGGSNSRSSSESDRRLGESNGGTPPEYSSAPPPDSVAAPPAFSHEPGAQPRKRPGVSPDLRRANSRLSVTTLSQLAEAGKNSTSGGVAATGAAAAWKTNSQSSSNGLSTEDKGQRGVMITASKNRTVADRSISSEGMVTVKNSHSLQGGGGSRQASAASSKQDSATTPYYKDKPLMSEYDLLSPTPTDGPSRNISPLSQVTMPNDSHSPSTGSTGHRKLTKAPRAPLKTGTETPKGQKASSSPQRPLVSRSSTSHSITRKPVPVRMPTRTSPVRSAEPPLPAPEPSIDDLHDQYVDEDALAEALDRQHTNSLTSQTRKSLHDDASSDYDNDSNASPDYASTAPRKSTETRRSEKSVERPRRGVLKTVGTVEPEPEKPVQVGDFTYKPTGYEPSISSDIPTVDFGPTKAYDPASSSRPNTCGTLNQAKIERTHTPERLTPSPSSEANDGRRSPLPVANETTNSHKRSPSRNLATPEPQIRPGSAASDNDNRRSIAWQPGTAIGSGSPGSRPSLTPEQFVQQRAAANRVTPIYAHAQKRSGSHTPPISGHRPTGSHTPPGITRHASGEIQTVQRHSPSPGPHQKRMSSYGNDMPPRPSSRSASMMMAASGDYSAHLSAREQEHVARVTGSPLINMASNAKSPTPPGSGLVGAIEAREKEKRGIKEGLSGQMVQHAIAQRQQHERANQTRQASYSTPTPQYAMPGGYPPNPVHRQYSGQPSLVQQQYRWGQQPPPQQFHVPLQSPQPPFQYPSQQWTPPSAGSIYGGQHPQQQQQYSPQNPQGYYGTTQYQQSGGYGPYFGNGNANYGR